MYLDYRLIARDGRVVWVRDEELVVNDPDGRPAAAHGYMQDVTARRQDSIRLELLVGILSLAADETPPDEIVAHAAQSLAGLFGNVDVSYVERRDEGGFWIRYTTDKGKPEFWNEVEWSADYVERIEQGPIVIEDISKEAWLDPVRDQLIARGVASSVDVPLFSNGVLSGVLWFNSASPRTWGEHDVSVLVDVAGQLAIVLAGARARELRARRRTRPTQPRRDPPGRQPVRRALPRPAKRQRRDRRADARPRRGHGRHERVCLRERRARRPVHAHSPARRLGIGPEQFDGRRPTARPCPACPPLPTLGRGSGPRRRRQQPHP